MEYAQTFEREAMKKRLSESDLEAPTLIDVVVRHEQAIKDARDLRDRIADLESQLDVMRSAYDGASDEREQLREQLAAVTRDQDTRRLR